MAGWNGNNTELHEQLREAGLKLSRSRQFDLSSNEEDVLLKQLSQWASRIDKCLSVLLIGKTGCGKSTLVNGILGLKSFTDNESRAEQGDKIGVPCQKQLQMYQQEKNGVAVTIWDSPGLQDGTERKGDYLKQMKVKCSNVGLVLCCIKVADTRFVRGNDNPDVVAMRLLTETFGSKLWEKTVFILTFANLLDGFHQEWQFLSEAAKIEAFNAKIKEWEDQIKVILAEDVNVTREIVDNITVVPAGHYLNPHLIGQKYWLSNIWFKCLHAIASIETRCALLQINLSRFKKSNEVEVEELKKELEEQPIVVTDHTLRNFLAGTTIGGLIGGLLGGPVGAAAGVAAGAGLIGILMIGAGRKKHKGKEKPD